MKRAMTWCFASCLAFAGVVGCNDDDDSKPSVTAQGGAAGEGGGNAGESAVETGGTAGETGETGGTPGTGGSTGGTGGLTGGTAGETGETGGTAGETSETGGAAGAPVVVGGAAGAPVVVGGAAGAPVVVGGAAGAPVAEGGAGGAGPTALEVDCAAECAVIQELECPDEGTEEACVTNCVASGAEPCATEYAAWAACLAGTSADDWFCSETEDFEIATALVCVDESEAYYDCLAG